MEFLGTRATDGDLEYIAAFTELRYLEFSSRMTDAGLGKLNGFNTELEDLYSNA